MKANEARWGHCAINLSIYTTFVLGTCERVAESRVNGKTDEEALVKLAGAFTVRDHWHTQALMLADALPKLDGHLRQLAASALENYRKAADVLWEVIGLVSDELQSSNIVVH